MLAIQYGSLEPFTRLSWETCGRTPLRMPRQSVLLGRIWGCSSQAFCRWTQPGRCDSWSYFSYSAGLNHCGELDLADRLVKRLTTSTRDFTFLLRVHRSVHTRLFLPSAAAFGLVRDDFSSLNFTDNYFWAVIPGGYIRNTTAAVLVYTGTH